ncbi:MAG: hypothetical protein OXR66_04290 [Candidatus Woesearchaeota archaeon]|nr:hypothetical protein [Candidatus Woesearchaeota archaeon]
MKKSTANTLVNVYAILAWIGAFLALVGGLGMCIFGVIGAGAANSAVSAGIFGTLGFGFGLFLIAVGIFDLIVGLALWNRKPWARTGALVLSILSVLSFPIGTLIGGFGIYFFGFEEKVRAMFARDVPKRKVARVVKKAKKKASRKKAKKQ